jgi:hypothetical protein
MHIYVVGQTKICLGGSSIYSDEYLKPQLTCTKIKAYCDGNLFYYQLSTFRRAENLISFTHTLLGLTSSFA